MTSWRNRTSICGDVCPPMPRFRYGRPGKKPRAATPHLRDLIAHEDDAILARRGRFDFAVLAAVARQSAPVGEHLSIGGQPRLQTPRRGRSTPVSERERPTRPSRTPRPRHTRAVHARRLNSSCNRSTFYYFFAEMSVKQLCSAILLDATAYCRVKQSRSFERLYS